MKKQILTSLVLLFALIGFNLTFYVIMDSYFKVEKWLYEPFMWQITEVKAYNENSLKSPQKPISSEIQHKEYTDETFREVTAYNVGDINQCSGNPCISANGENICLALEKGYKRCAANFVPFGTKLLIENYGECLVVDRLNSRYKNRVDIAMKFDEKERALNFGIQNLIIKILK